jgi:cytochrome c
MKKIFVLLSLATLIACGGKTEKEATTNTEEYSTPESKPAEVAPTNQIAEGEALVKAGDCKTCHHPTNKIIGPSHTEVAKKYEFTEANVKLLATKIIQGGQGVWGQIPMTAHVDVTTADAEKMARYVLSLDGETEH